MTQEQIQMQADKYAKEYGLNDATTFGMSLGFKAGANWRIKSVWHDRTENASMENGEIIFVFHDGSAMTKSILGWNWADIQGHFKFIKWAYIKDLLPEE